MAVNKVISYIRHKQRCRVFALIRCLIFFLNNFVKFVTMQISRKTLLLFVNVMFLFVVLAQNKNFYTPDEFEELKRNQLKKSRSGMPIEKENEITTDSDQPKLNFTLDDRSLVDIRCNPPLKKIRGRCRRVLN